MCRCLGIQASGFYAWLKAPLSRRAKEDVRQTELIRKAWQDSGKVYGYRKLHDDLLDQGETCCPNRVARLAGLAGIKAQIGYKRRPLAQSDAILEAESTHLIDQGRTFADHLVPDPMKSLNVHLIDALDWHKPHRRPCHRFGNRLGIKGV
jgi:hypothetical protein